LPRLIGVPAALDLILTGKTVDGSRAFKMGLVDDVLAKEDFVPLATRLLTARLDPPSWERTRRDRRRRRAGPPAWALEGNPLGRAAALRQGKKSARQAADGTYPAAVQAA